MACEILGDGDGFLLVAGDGLVANADADQAGCCGELGAGWERLAYVCATCSSRSPGVLDTAILPGLIQWATIELSSQQALFGSDYAGQFRAVGGFALVVSQTTSFDNGNDFAWFPTTPQLQARVSLLTGAPSVRVQNGVDVIVPRPGGWSYGLRFFDAFGFLVSGDPQAGAVGAGVIDRITDPTRRMAARVGLVGNGLPITQCYNENIDQPRPPTRYRICFGASGLDVFRRFESNTDYPFSDRSFQDWVIAPRVFPDLLNFNYPVGSLDELPSPGAWAGLVGGNGRFGVDGGDGGDGGESSADILLR